MKILFQYQPVLLSKLWTILTKMKRSGKAKLRPVDPNLQTSDQILLRNGRRKGFMPGNPPLHFSLYLKSDLDSNRTVKLMSSRSLIASKRFKTFGWVVFFSGILLCYLARFTLVILFISFARSWTLCLDWVSFVENVPARRVLTVVVFIFTLFAALLVKRPFKGVSKYIEFIPG